MIKLKVIQNTETLYKCSDHPDRCKQCPINVNNGGRCLGCSASKLKSCTQSTCDLGCDVCGGFKVKVPAVCCKSPSSIVHLTQASNGNYKQPTYKFSKVDPIHLDNRAVVVARGGGVRTTVGSPYVDEVECVAATIKDVWSRKGFYSKDIKDYLRIPKSKKLLLITAQLDDWLEKAWEKEFFGGDDYTKHGIDYWMPVAYSVYINDANMNRYWQLLRTLYATEKGKAHFVSLPKTTGLRVDDLIMKALENIPQAIFNCQFSSKDAKFKYLLANVLYWHEKAPKHVSFWFIGAGTPLFCHNLKKITKGRRIYFISSNPFRLANHGKELLSNGKAVKREAVTKEDLLYKNQRTFIEIVDKHG